MGKEIKDKNDDKIRKRVSFSVEQDNKIQKAMEEEGYNNLSEYVVHLVDSRNQTEVIQQRVIQKFKYRYARIQTLHNKLVQGIDWENTRREFMMEVDALCREFV